MQLSRFHVTRSRLALALVIGLLATLLLSSFGSAPAQAAGSFRNPVSTGPDPFMTYFNGNYYLTDSENTSIKMWRSPSAATLLTANPLTLWTDSDPSRNRDIWAAAFFPWNGRWYLYYTADDGTDANHRMYVLESSGNDPAGPYTFKGKVYDPSNDYWAIDGIMLNNNGALYFIYSGYNPATNQTNLLYIAPMSNPWTISGTRTFLPAGGTCPEVREAPSTLQRNGRIFLIYSVCDTGKPDYHLEMMTASDTANLLNASSWTNNGVVFSRNDNAGVYGPGSNNFFKSPDGTQDWMAYHAKNTSTFTYDGRTSRIKQIGWNSDGTPNLGVPDAAGATLALPSGDPGPSPVGLNDTDTTVATNWVEYQGSWNSGSGCGVQCFWGNDHWSNQTNAAAIVHFNGVQAALLSVSDTGNGIAGISVDNGSETSVDYYAPIRQGEQLHYISPILPAGNHTLKIRVTGNKNASSGGTFISMDRTEIYSTSTGLANGNYKLTTVYGSNALDVPSCSSTNQTPLQIWNDLNNSCQTWNIQARGDGYYKLLTTSGKAMDVDACSSADYAKVQIYDDLNNDCQAWWLRLNSDGTFTLRAKNGGRVLDIASCGGPGTKVQLYDDLNNDCQKWRIVAK